MRTNWIRVEHSPRDFRHCRFFRKIQNDLRERNIELEKFTDRIIFMSMFNDIDWTRKGNDGICISNSEKVKTYAKRFSQGHWTFLCPGDEKKWYGTLHYTPEGKWDTTATQMVERCKDTGHPEIKSISALSRGILKKKNNRDTIHFNADASNTELLFRIIHSVNQLSIYGAVSNWREQFGLTEEEKVQEKPPGKKESVTKSVLTSVKSQEVKLLVSSPRRASGNSLRERFRTSNHCPRQYASQGFAKTQFSCIGFQLVWATKPDLTRTAVLGRSYHWCRQYTLSRVNPRSGVFAAIPGGTIIRPVIEVQIVKILDTCGLEIAVPSPNDSKRTSYVMISRGKSRFVDEVHIPNAELRSSAELLFELQKAEGREPCLAQSKTGIQETGAHVTSQTSIKETCADTLSVFLVTKNHSFDWEEVESYCCQFIVWRSSANSGLQNGYKNGASLRSRWKTTWRSGPVGNDKAGTAESVRKTGSTRFLRQNLASTYISRKQQDKVSVLWGFQKFLGLLPSNSRTRWWNNKCAWIDGANSDSLRLEGIYFFTGVVLSASNLSWRTEHSKWKGKRGRHTIFFTPLNPFGEDSEEGEPVMITQFLKHCTNTAIGNVIRMPSIG